MKNKSLPKLPEQDIQNMINISVSESETAFKNENMFCLIKQVFQSMSKCVITCFSYSNGDYQ